MSTSPLSAVKSLKKSSILFEFTSPPFFSYHGSLIPHEDGQVDPIKKDLLVVCTQRKEGEAKSQGISNVNALYICRGSRPTLLNARHFKCQLGSACNCPSLHTQHPSTLIFFLILLLTTPSYEAALFLLPLSKALIQSFHHPLHARHTNKRSNLLTPFKAGIFFVKQQRSKCEKRTTFKVMFCIQQSHLQIYTFLATIHEDLKYFNRLMYILTYLIHPISSLYYII
jgi:hypothetical protein